MRDAVRSLVRLAGPALLAVGFAGGVIFDRAPDLPAVQRAGYRVLEADFHAHTSFSDGSLTPMGIVRQAQRRGLDVVALTEHNTLLPAQMARAWSRLVGGPIVVVGEEITTSRFHIIALGPSSSVPVGRDAAQVVRDIHARGGLAIAAHPVSRFWPALVPVRAALDGAEVMHPLAYAGAGRTGWRWPEMVQFYEEAQPPLAAVGSSDYHWGSVLGLCRTFVFVREPASEESVLDALRAHRTVVRDREGKLYGDPLLVGALEREPLPYDRAAAADYRYVGQGTLDRVTRALGWLGLVAFVLLGRDRGSRARPAHM